MNLKLYRVFNQLPEDPLTPYSGEQMMTVGVTSCSKFYFVTEKFELFFVLLPFFGYSETYMSQIWDTNVDKY